MKTTINLVLLLISLTAMAEEGIKVFDENTVQTITASSSNNDQFSFKQIIDSYPKHLPEWNNEDYRTFLRGVFLPQKDLHVTPLLNQFRTMGGDAGNGGGAYICKGAKKEIEYAQSVDLWEASTLLKLNITKDNQIPAKIQALNTLYTLIQIHPYFTEILAILMDNVFNELDKKISEGVQDRYLAVVPDSLDLERPYSCPNSDNIPEYAQVINYTKDDEFKIDLRLYNALETESDRAALLVHESIYKLLRLTNGAKDSKNTRKLVGYLFSDSSVEKITTVLKTTLQDGYFTNLPDAIGNEIIYLTASCKTDELDSLLTRTSYQLFDKTVIKPTLSMSKQTLHGLLNGGIKFCPSPSEGLNLIKILQRDVPQKEISNWNHGALDFLFINGAKNVDVATINYLLNSYDQNDDSVSRDWTDTIGLFISKVDYYTRADILNTLIGTEKIRIDSMSFYTKFLFYQDDQRRVSERDIILLKAIGTSRPNLLTELFETAVHLLSPGILDVMVSLTEKFPIDLNFVSYDTPIFITLLMKTGTRYLSTILTNKSVNIAKRDAKGNNIAHLLLKHFVLSEAEGSLRLAKKNHPDDFKTMLQQKNSENKTPLEILSEEKPVEVLFRIGWIGTVADLLDPNK